MEKCNELWWLFPLKYASLQDMNFMKKFILSSLWIKISKFKLLRTCTGLLFKEIHILLASCRAISWSSWKQEIHITMINLISSSLNYKQLCNIEVWIGEKLLLFWFLRGHLVVGSYLSAILSHPTSQEVILFLFTRMIWIEHNITIATVEFTNIFFWNWILAITMNKPNLPVFFTS